MSNFIQYTVFGIMLGAGYAIAATGLVVTYTTSGVFNFAQGAVSMVAAFCYWELVVSHGLPVLVALLIILVPGAIIAGGVVERILMRMLAKQALDRFPSPTALLAEMDRTSKLTGVSLEAIEKYSI